MRFGKSNKTPTEQSLEDLVHAAEHSLKTFNRLTKEISGRIEINKKKENEKKKPLKQRIKERWEKSKMHAAIKGWKAV